MNDALQQQLVRPVENSHHGATYPVGRLPETCVTSSMHLSSTAISCSRLKCDRVLVRLAVNADLVPSLKSNFTTFHSPRDFGPPD
jgi:hypothetical protein